MKSKGLFLLGAVLAAGCERKPDVSAVSGKLAGQNLLLITLDTTRSDRLGCYGYKPAATPTLDAIAARGTLFEQAYAQAPLTLPSHCSIMTGRYPREHGVQDNGRAALGTTHPTLAAIFKEHGYATAAFVASFVLDSRFGLERGFDVYHDEMDEVSFATQPLEWQQPADVVTDRALEWLPQVKDKPFFAWVHYYDPHQPYAPPQEFRGPNVLLYDGELAFLDTQVKRLTDWLEASGLTQKTLVLVVGDHGEAFGEHGEDGHSNHVYDVNIHVPMIFAHPAVIPSGRRIPALVESVDLFPTIHQLFGWKAPEGLMSRPLGGAFADGKLEEATVYAESLFVFFSFAWAEQRTLITPEWKYVSSTKPELFDRKDDPRERENVVEKQEKKAAKLLAQLKERYEAMVPAPAAEANLDPATLLKLQGLGYTGGKTSAKEQFLTEGLPDPKDQQLTLTKLKGAKEMLERAKTPEDVKFVIPLLRHIVRESPRSQMFHFMLGMGYLQAHELELALGSFKEAVHLDQSNAQAVAAVADTLVKLGRIPEALEHFSAANELDDKSADMHFRYAEALLRAGQPEEAVTHYRKALGAFPDFAVVHLRLAQVLKQLNRKDEAAPYFESASQLLKQSLGRKPDDADVHFRLGSVYLHTDRYSEAVTEFREALRLKADHTEAMVNLAAALEAQNELAEAEALLKRAISFPGVTAEAWQGLGVLLNKRGAINEAIAAYEKAIEIDPARISAIQELTGYYLGNRRIADARRILEIGAKNSPNNVVFHNMLAKLLATAPNDLLRNGKLALEHALQANTLMGDKDPSVLATLAAAHAETGDFAKAIEIANRAIELAKAANQNDLAAAIGAQLEGYRRGQPVRDPRFSSL